MDFYDDSVNFTLLTTGSSNDESMFTSSPQIIDDIGVLHMIDSHGDRELERDIADKTGYEVKYYNKPTGHKEINSLIELLVDAVERSRDQACCKTDEEEEKLQYVVLSDFSEEDELLNALQEKQIRVISPVLIRQCIAINKPLSSIPVLSLSRRRAHPLFSIMMSGLTICFTNFSAKSDLTKMRWKVHVLGGKIAREYDPTCENIILIAARAGREKFVTAMTLGNPVLKKDWLEDCFNLRMDPNALPRLMYAEDNIRYACPIFYGFKFFLIGFKHEDEVDIRDNCRNYGAQVIQNIRHRELSHIILCAPESDDHTVFKPYIEELRRIYYSEREPKVEFVNDKWFYESVSTSCLLSSKQYIVTISDDGILNFKPEYKYLKHSQKRLKEDDGSGDGPSRKKRSSSDANCSVYSNLSITSQLPRTPTSLCPRTPKALPQPPEDKRDKVICEFIRTEETYVRHLDIIWQRYYDYMYNEMLNPRDSNPFKVELPSLHFMFQKVPPLSIVHSALLKKLALYEASEKQQKDPKNVCEKQSFGKILLNWIGKEVMEDENDPRGRTHRDFSREEMIELFEYDKDTSKEYQRWKKTEAQSKKVEDGSSQPSQDQAKSDQSDGSNKNGEHDKSGEHSNSGQHDNSDQHDKNGTDKNDKNDKKDLKNQIVDPGVLRHYTSYMKAHEDILKLIAENEQNCFRFKSYLRSEGSKRENDRLSIRDLMIEPVQRLPRIILLLDAIIKKTEKRHGDLELLEYVRDEFKKVTASVNESKRHLDQKKDLVNFLMQNQIFGMPGGIVSSTKHVLVEQYHFKLDKDFGNFSAGTDIGLWLFVLDREKKERGQEMIFTEEDDSILEIAYMPQRKAGSISGGTAEKSLRNFSKSFCYKHVLHIPLRLVANVCEVHHQSTMELEALGVWYNFDPHYTRDKDQMIVFRLVNEEFLGAAPSEKGKNFRSTLVKHVNDSKIRFNLPTLSGDGNFSNDNFNQMCKKKKLSDSCKDLRSKPSFLEKVSGKVARALTLRQGSKPQPGTLQKAHSLANLTPSKKQSNTKVRVMRDSH